MQTGTRCSFPEHGGRSETLLAQEVRLSYDLASASKVAGPNSNMQVTGSFRDLV